MVPDDGAKTIGTQNRKASLMAAAALALAVTGGMYLLLQRHPATSTRMPSHAPASYPAPDFTLQSLSGAPVHLSDFHGKVVLLDYWATWCAPCKIEIPQLVKLQNKYGPRGLQVIGISMDDGPEPVKLFAQEMGMNYPVVMGDVKVAEAYGGVLGLPVVFLIDRQGRVALKSSGDAEMHSLEQEVQQLVSRP